MGFQVGFHVHLKLGCLLFSKSEVKQCCFLWLICSACHCLFVRQLVRLNLVPLSFSTSDPPLLVGRTLLPSFPSTFVSRSAVVSLVWIQFELGQLGIFVNSFVDSLGWLLQDEFVVFLWSFHTSLAGSTIYPTVVQVSVDVHAVHPSDHTSV